MYAGTGQYLLWVGEGSIFVEGGEAAIIGVVLTNREESFITRGVHNRNVSSSDKV